MKLYFICPQTQATFLSDDYSLQNGHQIVDDEHGGKKLKGVVRLNSGCPLCGRKHWYEVKDVICPLSGEKNEE